MLMRTAELLVANRTCMKTCRCFHGSKIYFNFLSLFYSIAYRWLQRGLLIVLRSVVMAKGWHGSGVKHKNPELKPTDTLADIETIQ